MTGALEAQWVRRSRYGWAWLDEMEVPWAETREQYRLRLVGTSGSIEIQTDAPKATVSDAALAVVGSGSAIITVQQIGDRGVSRATVAQLILP